MGEQLMNNFQMELIECDELFVLSMEEVCLSFGVSQEVIIEIIDEGIIYKPASKYQDWQFGDNDLFKIRTVLQLHQDLGVNFAGAALALELMAKLEELTAST